MYNEPMDANTTTTTGQLADARAVAAFILAGKATFTVVSERTGTRFTFKVQAKQGDDGTGPLFVKVLTGSDNEGDYTYLGCLWRNGSAVRYTHGRRSSIGENAPSARAFAWLARQVFGAGQLAGASFMHAGKCGRCGRKLTDPTSIASGLGPHCRAA